MPSWEQGWDKHDAMGKPVRADVRRFQGVNRPETANQRHEWRASVTRT